MSDTLVHASFFYVPVRKQGHVVYDREPLPQQLLTSPFCLGTNVVGTKVYGLHSLESFQAGELLHSDWLPPNRVIAHYHKVDLISTLLDALIVQNAPRRSSPPPLFENE